MMIAVAVVEHRGKYLIGQRPEGVALAGYWEFPGGKVNPGEHPQAAAMRECQEETGLVIDVVDEYPAQSHHYDHGQVLVHFFRCNLRNAALVQPSPPFQWVERQELANYQFPEANADLLKTLLR